MSGSFRYGMAHMTRASKLPRIYSLCLLSLAVLAACPSPSREALPSDGLFSETTVLREKLLPEGLAVGATV